MGTVIRGPREIARVLTEFLRPENLAHYRSNAAALNNRAVFEIPVILRQILEKTTYPMTGEKPNA